MSSITASRSGVLGTPHQSSFALQLWCASLKREQSADWPPYWLSRNEVAAMKFAELLQRGSAGLESEICLLRDANRTVCLELSCNAWLLIDGEVCVDRILRTETLSDNLRTLCADLGLPSSEVLHLNESTSGTYQSYYIKKRAH